MDNKPKKFTDEEVSKIINWILNTIKIPEGIEHEDLYQTGWVGYLTAIQNKSDKELTSTYIIKYIRGYILNELNRETEKQSHIDQDTYLEDISYSNIEYIDRILDLEKFTLKNFDPKVRDIINKLYLIDEPMTLKEVGESMGISAERVRQIRDKAIESFWR